MTNSLLIEVPPDITLDERVFLIKHLKVSEKKLNGVIRHRDAKREQIRVEKRKIVNDYSEYKTVRDQVIARRDRLETGDLSARLRSDEWADNGQLKSSFSAAQQSIGQIEAKVLTADNPEAFVRATREMANIKVMLDDLIAQVFQLQHQDPEPEDGDPAPDPPSLDAQRTLLEQRPGASTGIVEQDGSVARATMAARDLKRLELVEADQTATTARIAAISERIDGLAEQLAGRPDPAQALRLREEAKQLATQQSNLQDHLEALSAYADGFPVREAAAAEAAAMSIEVAALAAWDDTTSADQYIAKLTTTAEGETELAENLARFMKEIEGQSPTDDALKQANEQLTARIELDAQTPLPSDARMYLDEPDVTKISLAQRTELLGMIAASEKLRENDPPKINEGWALTQCAQATLVRFVAQRSMRAPNPLPVSDLRAELQRTLAQVQVELDRFWGLGGDADKALRNRLATLQTDLDRANTEDALKAVEAAIAAFKTDLANARMDFVPTGRDPDSAEGRTAALAAERSTEIKSKLLDVYVTTEIKGTQLTGVDRSLLIVVPTPDGDTFHLIQTQADGDRKVKKLKNSKIPRETAAAFAEKAAEIDGLLETNAPEIGSDLLELQREAESLELNLTPAKAQVFADIRLGIRKCRKEAGYGLFEEFEPSSLKSEIETLDNIERSYPTAADLDAVLAQVVGTSAKKPDGGLWKTFSDMQETSKQTKTRYGEVAKVLKRIDDQLAGKTGWFSNRSNIGTAMARLVELEEKLAGRMSGQTADWADPTQKAQVMTALITIKESLATMSAAQEAGVSYQGQFAATSSRIHMQLERKTSNDVNQAKVKADALEAEIGDTVSKMPDIGALEKFAKGKVNKLGEAASLEELEKLAGFLGDAATGAAAMQEAKEKAEAAKTAALEALDLAKTALDEAATYRKILGIFKKTDVDHPRRGEYKDLKSDFDDAVSEFEDGGDPGRAQAHFDRIRTGAATFTNLQSMAEQSAEVEGPIKFSPTAARGQAKEAVAGVVNGVRTLGTGLVGRADPDDTVAAQLVSDMLGGVDSLAGAADALFTGGCDVADMERMAELPDADRTAATRNAREIGLRQLRALEARVGEHPAVTLYRSNPSDGLVAWTPFRQAMLNVELSLTRDLN